MFPWEFLIIGPFLGLTYRQAYTLYSLPMPVALAELFTATPLFAFDPVVIGSPDVYLRNSSLHQAAVTSHEDARMGRESLRRTCPALKAFE